MKVLQIINNLGTGGAEKLLLDSFIIYREKEIEMDLLVLDGSDYPFMTKFKSMNSVKIHSLNANSVYNPISIFKIIPYLKNYDLVHVHLFPSLYWISLAKIISFSKVKIIFTEHNTSNRRIKNVFLKYIDRLLYSPYSKIVCITEEVSQVMKKHLKYKDFKFETIKNGISLDTIFVETPYKKSDLGFGITDDDTILIQVSRFDLQKNQAILLQAMLNLPLDVKLLLVGDGELRAQNEKLVAELKLEERVFFLGVRMDVPKLLKTADVIILSSHYEGLSISSIEGMASGKPFIGSDVPGLREIVSGAGLLFPSGDAMALAETIISLIEDEEYAKKIASKCIERSMNYDINVMVDNYIQLYHKVINQNN
jgi:glycosyltransferase involved in cell wall biosynthesis